MLALARQLGTPLELDEGAVIETSPADAGSSWQDPFDRAESIGWHNDFTSHAVRPRLSLAWLARADPAGALAGAWRVAVVSQITEALERTPQGRQALRLFRRRPLPFSYTGSGDAPCFHVLEADTAGMRFYGRGIRQGCQLAWGEVPLDVEAAVGAVEHAADQVGTVLAAEAGALLITDNSRTLHDRLPQTVRSTQPLRRCLLCFVG